MKVDGTSGMRGSVARPVRRTGDADASAFADHLSGPASSASLSGSGPVGGLAAVLALQTAPDPGLGRRRAVRRAEDLLDQLDALRVSILLGRVPREMLETIVARLSARGEEHGDPRLAELVGEIELRAAVELAKLDMR